MSTGTTKENDDKNNDLKQITVNLGQSQFEWLKAQCAEMHESYSTVIRGLIREKMEASNLAPVNS